MAALSLAAGGDVRVHGRTAPISAFVIFRDNGAKARAGLGLKSNAPRAARRPPHRLRRGGLPAQGYGLSWYGGTDPAEVFRLSTAVGDAGHAQALSFRDDGMRLVRGLGGEANSLYVRFVANRSTTCSSPRPRPAARSRSPHAVTTRASTSGWTPRAATPSTSAPMPGPGRSSRPTVPS